MVTCSNILVVTILILVSNFNIGIWLVNGCSGRDFRCGPDGPPIRFPFRLKDKETEQSCGYNGFDLTCSDTHKTQIEFPSPSGAIILEVMKIIYPDNSLYVTDPENCLPRQLVKLLRSPISPFQFFESPGVGYNFTILRCSSSLCPVIVVDSSDTLFNSGLDPIDCTKTSDSDFTSSAKYPTVNDNQLVLTWSKPNCSKCEKEGKMCKLKNNGTEDGEIECFDRHHKPTKKILLYVTVGFVGLVLVTLILTACLHFYTYFKLKGEDETRIEKFLQDYRTLNPARFSYTDIKRITNSFREKLGEGAHGAVFKGKLSNEILVAKVLNCGPHHLMRPQYCGCGRNCNRIGPQLRCELKSHVMPQRNSISPQHNGVLTATTATVLSNIPFSKNSENLIFIFSFMSFHFRVPVFLCLNELSRR